jgi:hypothetical protein
MQTNERCYPVLAPSLAVVGLVAVGLAAIACRERPHDQTAATAAPPQQAQPTTPQTDARSRPAVASPPAASTPDSTPRDAEPIRVEMKNVDFHVDADIVLHIRRLRGALLRTRAEAPASFDDKQSFTLDIASGEIGIDPEDLGRLLNRHVFNYPGSPLKHLDVSIEKGQLKQTGTVHKGIDIPFTLQGGLDVTPDGKLRLHAASVKVAGLPAKGLMGLFGVELDRLVKVEQGRGVSVQDDDIILDLERLLPSPKVRGRVSGVEIRQNRIVQFFGPRDASGAPSLKPPAPPSLNPPEPKGNYMYYRGGTLRFGRLTMTDADIELIDADPRDAFDFFQDRYQAQLVAGYSKTTPASGLAVYMVDLNDLTSGGPRDLRPTKPPRARPASTGRGGSPRLP